MLHAILESARQQLAEVGPAELSLRAIARELGVVSSAVYRYVESRDALLTLLILDAYNDLGEFAENAEAKIAREDLLERFVAIGVAVRTWALAHPHEYALIFGTPVHGYDAPEETNLAAARVPLLLTDILRARQLPFEASVDAEIRTAKAALAPLRSAMGSDIPEALLGRGLTAWMSIFGAVSMETFGHLHNVVADSRTVRRRFFEQELRNLAVRLGLFD